MPRPGPLILSRPAMFALAMLVWLALPLGARPAQASGCHIPERPILGVNPAGFHDRHIAAWSLHDRTEAAPPVLTRVPCPGETPRPTVIPIATVAAAWLSAIESPPERPTGSFHAIEDADGPDPRPFRLDRPPR